MCILFIKYRDLLVIHSCSAYIAQEPCNYNCSVPAVLCVLCVRHCTGNKRGNSKTFQYQINGDKGERPLYCFFSFHAAQILNQIVESASNLKFVFLSFLQRPVAQSRKNYVQVHSHKNFSILFLNGAYSICLK